jgi:hypothetical protein
MIIVACSRSKDEIPLAKVGNKTLYYSDLMLDFSVGYSKEDSLRILQSEIKHWIMSELMAREADSYLDIKEKDFSRQIEEYKKSLSIFQFEKKWVLNNLDTIVAEADIEGFYNSNKSDFELKTNVLRLRFVKIDNSKPNSVKEQAKRLLFSNSYRDLPILERFCEEYAENYFLDDSVWLIYDDVIKEIPFGNVIQKGTSSGSRKIELSDNNYDYFVLINELRIKDDISPLSIEKDNIRLIILQQRKAEMLDSLYQNLFINATNSGTYTIY